MVNFCRQFFGGSHFFCRSIFVGQFLPSFFVVNFCGHFLSPIFCRSFFFVGQIFVGQFLSVIYFIGQFLSSKGFHYVHMVNVFLRGAVINSCGEGSFFAVFE